MSLPELYSTGGSYLCNLRAERGAGQAKPRLDTVWLTIEACGAFQSMNAIFLLQVLLWCGHRRKAITDILFHSIYSQKSVCNLVVDWLEGSVHMVAVVRQRRRKKKSTVLKPERTGRLCISSKLQGGSGPLSFIFKCACSQWGWGRRATLPNIANYCFASGLVWYIQRGKKGSADFHRCPMRNDEG